MVVGASLASPKSAGQAVRMGRQELKMQPTDGVISCPPPLPLYPRPPPPPYFSSSEKASVLILKSFNILNQAHLDDLG